MCIIQSILRKLTEYSPVLQPVIMTVLPVRSVFAVQTPQLCRQQIMIKRTIRKTAKIRPIIVQGFTNLDKNWKEKKKKEKGLQGNK